MRRLQAGNCFINFNGPLGKCETKVLLKSDQIIIQINNESHTIETSEFFSINVKSFYNLLVKDTFISFRFITEKRFDAEVIPNGSSSNSVKFQRLEVIVEKEDPVTLTCSNCESTLTDKDVTFKRILELPSNSMAISDWFCHRHEGEKIFQESDKCFNEETIKFEPKPNDLFYGPFHLLFNSQIFDMSRFRQKEYFHCKRCLQLICKKSSGNCLHFWWENVKFNGQFMYRGIVEPIDLVRRITANHISCDSLAYLSPIIKIIFESSVPNTGQKLHLLLQIMDKNLKLLKLDKYKFKLVEVSSIKVMFLILNQIDNDDDERTLKYWQKDINTQTFEFSFKMFTIFSDYLAAQAEIIPEIYRFNNSFQLSYIEI
jgi:hypothetical protein